MGKRGRPAKQPADLITIEQAVFEIKAHLETKYGPVIADKCCLAKGTLYNKTSSGALQTWPVGRFALVSKAEVLGLVK